MIKKAKYFLATLVAFVIVFLVNYFLDIISTEGFNPSDDGVILAQSFRLLNGEIPHKDFIAIRPVFSGILHSINFYTPLALEVSARWFVFIQFFVYSFIWVYLLFKSFINKPKLKYFVLIGIIGFLLNINFYNLYPWTTIDALFWFIIGLSFLFLSYNKRKVNTTILFSSIGFLFMALAVLSRQTFAIPFAIIWILFTHNLYKSKQFKKILFTTFFGAFPFILYLIILIVNDSFSLFITQMTGRTELFKTGIATYAKQFFYSKLVFIHLFALIGILYHLYKNKFKLYVDIPKERKRLFFSFLGIYFGAIIFFTFYAFFQNIWGLFNVSFELFWIALISSIYILVFFRFQFSQKLIILSSILLAWTSSISLGDNAPVFATGILVTTSIIIIYRFSSTIKSSFFQKINSNYIFAFTLVLCALLFYFEIRKQRAINYRDKSASELTHNLGETFTKFGNIKTNENTFNYFADLRQVLNELENSTNNFIVIPNNAIIYPIRKSKNPFPVDWLQRDEYIGSEDYLSEKIISVLNNRSIYVIVDKFDSKKLAQGLFKKEYDLDYYTYLNVIKPRMKKLNIESSFFKVYITN